MAFIKKAVNRGSPEYKELYFFLVRCFLKGDKDREGTVGQHAFDLMVEEAAATPRKFGLAPSSAEIFPNPQVCINCSAQRRAKKSNYSLLTRNPGNAAEQFRDKAVSRVLGKSL